MKTAWRSATLLLAAAGTLVGCSPGTLQPAPSPRTAPESASGEGSRPGTHPAPSTTAAPAAEAASRPVLLATLAASDGLAIVDPDAAEPVLDVIEVGAAPWGVAARDGIAYVSTAEGLAIVDLTRRERTALVPYAHPATQIAHGEYRDGGLGIAIAPGGERVYVAVHRWPDPAWLEVYDVDDGAFVGSVDVGIRPFDVLADPAGQWVATVDHDSYTVSFIDPDDLDASARAVEIAPFGNLGFAGWEKPHYAAITDDGRIALPYQGLVTVLLDPVTGATEHLSATANSHQHGIVTAPDGTLVAVGTGAFGTATGGPNVALLDPATGQERVFALDRPHETAAVWQAAADAPWSVALAGGFTRDGWWDGLTLVDPEDGTTREIPLRGRPQHVIAAGVPREG